MPENINKAYVKRQVEIAMSTDNEDVKKDALYRAGTQMEVIPCDGNANCDLNDIFAKRSRNASKLIRTRYTSYLRHES